MRLIRQRGRYDCGVACLAMVLSVSYEDICRLLPADKYGPQMSMGMAHYDFFEVLYRYGRTYQYVSRWNRLGEPVIEETETGGIRRFPLRVPWPLKPWATGHLVQVPGHWIAMDGEGRLFDPSGLSRSGLGAETEVVIGVF